jgi:hypothetical protein
MGVGSHRIPIVALLSYAALLIILHVCSLVVPGVLHQDSV